MSNEKRRVLVITGPTASGKTDVSILLAELFKKSLHKTAEIISADSRQVYKHIPIATSQPLPDILNKYKHHFIGELELNEEFSAGEFANRARNVVNNILRENRIPIVTGGSGLYINSLVYGLFDLNDFITEESDTKRRQKEIRKELYEWIEKEGIEILLDELKKIDPESAAKMKIHNERRIIRALEINYLTGISISQFHKKPDKPAFEPIIFGIKWDRKKLYERINSRVDRMLDAGLIEEVTSLKEKGFDYGKYNSLNTVGVKEVIDYLDGKINYQRMTELIKQNTRRFAKRQMTWFRKDKNIKWIEVADERELKDAAERIFQYS